MGEGLNFALRRVATVFDVDLHLSSGLVTQQSDAHDHSHRLPPPMLARCHSDEMIIHWENIVAGNSPAVDSWSVTLK